MISSESLAESGTTDKVPAPSKAPPQMTMPCRSMISRIPAATNWLGKDYQPVSVTFPRFDSKRYFVIAKAIC